MSTITASNISDGTDTVGTEYVINGSAKSWVNFDGTGTVSIRDSLNTSSITDNGTGQYSVGFTSSFANTNYSSVFGGIRADNSSTESSPNMSYQGLTFYTTSGFRMSTYDNNSDGYRDSVMLNSHSTGDLA